MLVRVLSVVPDLKHSGVDYLVASDDTFLTSTHASITDNATNATCGAIGGDAVAIKRALPAYHCNFQNRQPALFDVQSITEESVGGFGLV